MTINNQDDRCRCPYCGRLLFKLTPEGIGAATVLCRDCKLEFAVVIDTTGRRDRIASRSVMDLLCHRRGLEVAYVFAWVRKNERDAFVLWSDVRKQFPLATDTTGIRRQEFRP